MPKRGGIEHLQPRLDNGRGALLGGGAGTLPAEVVIIGGGVVRTNAARMAVGLGARAILDVSLDRLRQLDDIVLGRGRSSQESG